MRLSEISFVILSDSNSVRRIVGVATVLCGLRRFWFNDILKLPYLLLGDPALAH
jgi:hypothetical protein